MFSNSSNFIIQNGSFTNVQGSGLNGLEVLQRHVSPDALHNSLEQSNSPKCHPNTRTAVLKDILSWAEDDTSETQVLWLHGPAGAGKTAIGHSVAEMSQERNQFAAGFFFSRTAAGRNHEKCLIATIAYQLLQSIPEARSFIEAAATKDPLIFMQSSTSQIKHLIVDPLKQMLAKPHDPSFPKLIVVDGLDECSPQESQTNILTAIHTALKQDSFPFRVIICSRAEPDICDVFESELADATHQISLDDKYDPDIDIALYLRSKFSEIVRKHHRNRGMRSLPLPWPSEKTIKTLVSKASGQFIYAATVIRYVDVRHERPDDRLKTVLGLSGSQFSNPFTELDELYQEIFRAVVDIPLTSRLLGALLLLKTPLPIASLENLLELQPGDAELALCHLHSVVRIPNDIDDHASGQHIGLYHASLGDFLFDSQRAGVHHIKMDSAHTTLAESCLRILSNQLIPRTTSIRRDMILMGIREDPAVEYAWDNWIHHFLNISSWDDKVISEFRKLQPWVLLVWLNRRSIDEPLRDLRSNIDQFNKLKSWFIRQDTNHKTDGLVLGTVCKNVLELFFKNAWADILGDRQNVNISLGILAVVLKSGSVSSASLATLFKLDWVGFARATFLLRPYINFGTSVDVACDAFSDFISHPEYSSEFNPNTPDVHADLVIRCVECISSYRYPTNDKQIWQLDPEGAFLYSRANWKDHLRQASSRPLLDYAYAATTRLGYLCIHDDPCDNLCDTERIIRCIESNIVAFFPNIRSTSDINFLHLLKEIIAAKSLHGGPSLPEIIPSLTTSISLTVKPSAKDSPVPVPKPELMNESIVNDVMDGVPGPGAFSRQRDLSPSLSPPPPPPPSVPQTVHGDYQYTSSQFLRHVNSTGQLSESSSSIPSCACISELASVPDMSRFTSDEHASLVIRVVQCIAAQNPTKVGQCEREQTLDWVPASVYHALFGWKEHLRHANPRRLLNYTYVINVRSGHQPICPDENKCDLLCDVSAITRCIESRIIDGEFFPRTLSEADTILLKMLREIIDVKYLQTPQFTKVNSRILVWSTAYRLEIARTQESDDASCSTK